MGKYRVKIIRIVEAYTSAEAVTIARNRVSSPEDTYEVEEVK